MTRTAVAPMALMTLSRHGFPRLKPGAGRLSPLRGFKRHAIRCDSRKRAGEPCAVGRQSPGAAHGLSLLDSQGPRTNGCREPRYLRKPGARAADVAATGG